MSTVRSPPSKSTAPHHVQQAVTGEELAPVQGQKAQQLVLARRQGQNSAGHVQRPRPGQVQRQAGQGQHIGGVNVALAERQQGQACQHLGGRVGGQQEVVRVGRPVRLAQVVLGEEGEARRRRQVVPPGVPQQTLGVAQGQAVVRRGQVGQQHVRRAPRERPAQGRHRPRAPFQGRVGDRITGAPQGARQQAGRTAFVEGCENENVQHNGMLVPKGQPRRCGRKSLKQSPRR